MGEPSHSIYLDHNGSTPTSPEVARELSAFIEGCWGNPGALHPDGRAAATAIEFARHRVAAALGAQPDEITFTSGGTEANNWALRGLLEALPPGRRHVVCGRHEHLSVIRSLEALERSGTPVTWVSPDESGAITVDDLRASLRADTGLVVLMLANNETGALQPIVEAARLAHGGGALLLIDAVCGAGKVAIDVTAIDCDALSLSGHKLHAPKGIGALWLRSGVEIAPLIHGCGQQSGRRSGTENTLGAVALGAAMERYAAGATMSERSRPLRDQLLAGIEALGVGAVRNGTEPSLGNTLSVWFPGHDALELQARLGAAGVSVSAQASRPRSSPSDSPSRRAASPSHVLKAMGFDDRRSGESLRFSLGNTTTAEEIETALESLRRVLYRTVSSPSGPQDGRRPMTSALQPGLAPPSRRRSGCALDDLTRGLAPLLAAGARDDQGAAVAALLREYAANGDGWRRFALFSKERYTRHLVWRCRDFELLLLCWGTGHASPIHDHAGQQCWMAVLEGALEEVHFEVEGPGAPPHPGRVKVFEAGGVAYIEDEIALHLIRPRAGERSVSLHLYSNPIDACHVFCPDTGESLEEKLSYDSVRGTPCGGQDPAGIRAAWDC